MSVTKSRRSNHVGDAIECDAEGVNFGQYHEYVLKPACQPIYRNSRDGFLRLDAYEGLIRPEREGRRRLYSQRDRIRVKLILRGQRLGLSLAEIGSIIDLYDAPSGEAGQLALVLERIDERRRELLARRADIDASLADLEGVAAANISGGLEREIQVEIEVTAAG